MKSYGEKIVAGLFGGKIPQNEHVIKPGDRVTYVTIFGTYSGTLLSYTVEDYELELVGGKKIVESHTHTAQIQWDDGTIITLSGMDFSFPHYNLRKA